MVKKERLSERPIPTAADQPVVWFAVLRRAILAHDEKLAAKASAELSRLGVSVKTVGKPIEDESANPKQSNK